MQYTLDEGITWHEASLPRFSVLAEDLCTELGVPSFGLEAESYDALTHMPVKVTQQLEAASTSFMVVGEVKN